LMHPPARRISAASNSPTPRPLTSKIPGDRLTIVDSAETTAQKTGRVLDRNGLGSSDADTPIHQIYVTASPERFTEVARVLFGEDLPPIRSVPVELVGQPRGREGAA